MTMDTTQQCLLCDGAAHVEPAEATYGLTCPGEHAPFFDQRQFQIARANARIVASRHTEAFASDPVLVAEIIARQDAAAARFASAPTRSVEITHEALVADCAVRTPAVVAMVDTNAALAPEEFEPPEHLRVPTTPPDRRRIRRVADVFPVGNLSDYALFLGETGVGQ